MLRRPLETTGLVGSYSVGGDQESRFGKTLLLAITELFVPVLDDSDRSGRIPVNKGGRQETLTVGGDIVLRPGMASEVQVVGLKEFLRLAEDYGLAHRDGDGQRHARSAV